MYIIYIHNKVAYSVYNYFSYFIILVINYFLIKDLP